MKPRTLLIAAGVLLVAILGIAWSLFIAQYVADDLGLVPATHSGPYNIRFGITANDLAGNPYLQSETTTIPFKTQDTGFSYGFEIKPPDNKPYTYRCIIHFAGVPKVISGDAFESTVPSATLSTHEMPVRGVVVSQFWFDPGDPLGPESIEVYINGKFVKTIKYTVVPAT